MSEQVGPVFTGQLQTQLSGDIDLAKSYIRDGRAVMGMLHATAGINDRMANNEPTGYHKLTKFLDDGSRITAWHNNGHNVLRIDTPRPVVSEERPEREEPESPTWVGEGKVKPGGVSHEDQPVEPPLLKQVREEEEEEEEKREEFGYYLWVGVRISSCPVSWPSYTCNAWMLEPDSAFEQSPDDGHAVGRGILDSGNNWAYHSSIGLAFSDDDSEARIDTPSDDAHYVDNMQQGIENQYEIWDDSFYVPGLRYGEHMFIVDDSDPSPFFCTSNGLRCTAISAFNEGFSPNNDPASDPDRWMPYDPMAENQNGEGRDGSMRDGGGGLYGTAAPLKNWDIVFWLDPGEDEGEFPCDTRPHIGAARRALEGIGMAKGNAQVLPGEYLLAVYALGQPPEPATSRAGEQVPGFDGFEPPVLRSVLGDYIQYMTGIGGPTNIGIEIEVRLGKGDNLQIFNFEGEIANSDNREFTITPYGYGIANACLGDGDTNPMGGNWMQGLIAIDVMSGTASWADADRASPILGVGMYPLPGLVRYPCRMYVSAGYVSRADPGDFASYAGYAVHRMMEYCTAGYYGKMDMNEFSLGAITAAFSGHDGSRNCMFDCTTGVVSEIEDLDMPSDEYLDWPDSYPISMLWYYPHKYLSRNACINSVGILLTAEYGIFWEESGQTKSPADPDFPDCCD